MLQPEHGFCQQNGPERGQLQDCYPDEKAVAVPVSLNGRCCSSGCVGNYLVNKVESDESLPFLVFGRHIVDVIFLEYSKAGRLSSSHAGIRNIPSNICSDETKHYQVQSQHRRTQTPFRLECFCVNSQHLKVVNWIRNFGSQFRSIFRNMSNIQDGGFTKIINDFSFLTIFTKSSMLHLRCLTRF